MKPQDAIERLETMQRQIIDGKRTFGDIADCIKSLLAQNTQLETQLGLSVERFGEATLVINELKSRLEDCEN